MGKARRLRIPTVFEGGATQPTGMHRPSNAARLSPRAAKGTSDVSRFGRAVRITNQEMSQMRQPATRTRTKASAGRPAGIVLIALSLIACGRQAFAQDTPADVINDSGPGFKTSGGVRLQPDPDGFETTASEIVVRIADDGPLHAAVRSVGARLAQTPSPIMQTNPPSSWVVRHPVVAGTLIGAGAGAALSRTQAVGGMNHDARVALVGAGAGAWGGLIASAVQKARAKEKVGVGTKIGIAAGAARPRGLAVARLLWRGRLWRRVVGRRAAVHHNAAHR